MIDEFGDRPAQSRRSADGQWLHADSKADPAVWRPTAGERYVITSSTNYAGWFGFTQWLERAQDFGLAHHPRLRVRNQEMKSGNQESVCLAVPPPLARNHVRGYGEVSPKRPAMTSGA